VLERELKRKTFKNALWLIAAQGVGKISKLLFFVLFARRLGSFKFGQFSFALSFATFFVIFTDIGISPVFIKNYQKKTREEEVVSILGLKTLLAILVWATIALTSLFFIKSSEIKELVLILGGFVALESFLSLIFALFQAQLTIHKQAILQALESILIATSGILVILRQPTLLVLACVYLGARIAVLIIGFWWARVYIKIKENCKNFWSGRIWARYVRESWPIFLSAFLMAVWANIDSVMMGFLGYLSDLGWYQAAYKIISTLSLPISLIAIVFFPALNKAYNQSKKEFRGLFNLFYQITLSFALIIGILAFLGAKEIILILYGREYFPAILAFKILLFNTIFYMITLPLTHLFIISNRQKILFAITFTATVTNVLLNFFLIPSYSLYGASIATVISSGILFIGLFLFRKIPKVL